MGMWTEGRKPLAVLSFHFLCFVSPIREGAGSGTNRAMRSRLFRFRDRASYKSSEVIGLFLISIFAGMIFFGICAALNALYERLFG